MTTATDFVSDLRERMAGDGFTLPETWEGRMQALVAGAIDADDATDLACCCGRIADSHAGNHSGPSFAWVATTLAEPAALNQALALPAVGEVLLAIAKYADGR